MPQLPLPPDVFAAQGYPHECNPSTPHQIGTSPLEIWYSGMVIQASYSSGAIPIDAIRGYPLVVGRSGVIDRIAVEVTGNVATAVGRCGIYRATSIINLYPSSLVVESGELDVSSTGIKAVTVSAFLEAGLYWMVFLGGVANGNMRRPAVSGEAPLLGAPTTLGANPNNRIEATFAYAALPSTFPASAVMSTSANHAVVHVRFAS